jgi:hypothetical protein
MTDVRISTKALEIVCKTTGLKGTALTKFVQNLQKNGLGVPKKVLTTLGARGDSKSNSNPRSSTSTDISKIPKDLKGYGEVRLGKLDKTSLVALIKRCGIKTKPKSKNDAIDILLDFKEGGSSTSADEAGDDDW